MRTLFDASSAGYALAGLLRGSALFVTLSAFSCSSSRSPDTGCAPGQQDCGECTDVLQDPANCGQCGVTCGQGSVCSRGVCASACDAGLRKCGASCVDTTRDSAHCGGCDVACLAGERCVASSCQPLGAGGAPSAGAGGASGGTRADGGSATAGRNDAGGRAGAGASSGGRDGGGGSSPGGTGAGGNLAGGSSAGGTGGSGTGGSNSGCSAKGFHVQDGALMDVKCNEFVLRGVNYPYTWYSSQNTQQNFAAIAAAGANAVRIVLSNGARWTRTPPATLASLIESAKNAKLVAILELHDTTGYSEQAGSAALQTATSYWTASDILPVLKGQEAYVLVNIGNEPNGNDTTNQWAPSHVTAVQALRSAGLTHSLMVDAPNWGQDWTNTMRDGGGSSIWDADPQKNLVFSVHMYDVYGAASTVTSYFNTFLSRYSAPLVVGEFAADHGTSGNVDEDAIMANAESLSLGYLGWSWSGNSTDLSSLDITRNFDAASLTPWGTRLIDGANGLKATSQRCTCFD